MLDPKFKAEDHSYTIGGILVPGCTTITGILPKEWLAPWASKECANYILDTAKDKLTPEVREIVLAGKNAWRRKSEAAADCGTMAHAHMELYAKTGVEPLIFENPKVENSFRLFMQWVGQNEILWLESEVVVGSEEFMYAGKFDAIARVNGKVTLIDFKTSTDIFPEYFYQLAGYQFAYEEMGKMPIIEQRMILWVPKTGDEFRAAIVPTPLENDKLVFLAALSLYRRLGDSQLLLNGLGYAKKKWRKKK